jgi:hypothetical protein
LKPTYGYILFYIVLFSFHSDKIMLYEAFLLCTRDPQLEKEDQQMKKSYGSAYIVSCNRSAGSIGLFDNYILVLQDIQNTNPVWRLKIFVIRS